MPVRPLYDTLLNGSGGDPGPMMYQVQAGVDDDDNARRMRLAGDIYRELKPSPFVPNRTNLLSTRNKKSGSVILDEAYKYYYSPLPKKGGVFGVSYEDLDPLPQHGDWFGKNPRGEVRQMEQLDRDLARFSREDSGKKKWRFENVENLPAFNSMVVDPKLDPESMPRLLELLSGGR